ncbi:cell division protein ZipA [Gynuella sunshinyii]|uniref:Cell division protein ZipA n=1 Tax=Gynuella sunshinyii YC6258 TaxID=1445510 RepID=A0A0C5VR50_9GAMM|nr:cell division protein ZipA [Gynuella sunshinyii]AJQ96716.1 cell division protein [Gynuella sunshinyii YC6258]
MELRHWLLILCILAIILIFLDGFRRWKERPKYKGSYTRDEEELSEFPSGELPNGGARVRPLSPQEILARNERINLDKKVPLLMETLSVEPEQDDFDSEDAKDDQYQQSLELVEQDEDQWHEQTDFVQEPEAEYETAEVRREPTFAADEQELEALEDTFDEPEAIYDPEPEDILEPESELAAFSEHAEAVKTEEKLDIFATEVPGQDLVEPQEVIVINVVSEHEGFDGEQLLQILLACGMRFGAMDIFHRTNDKGQLQFSMANCMKPGTFNIDNMGQQPIQGVSFFMTLPNSADAMQSFDYMHETANVVARHMHGVLKDEMHSVMRGQTVEHCRNRIREFARAQLLNA